eukprot:COSAG01_NODE_655_length_14476_cov_6.592265_5_plen_449_part_00
MLVAPAGTVSYELVRWAELMSRPPAAAAAPAPAPAPPCPCSCCCLQPPPARPWLPRTGSPALPARGATGLQWHRSPAGGITETRPGHNWTMDTAGDGRDDLPKAEEQVARWCDAAPPAPPPTDGEQGPAPSVHVSEGSAGIQPVPSAGVKDARQTLKRAKSFKQTAIFVRAAVRVSNAAGSRWVPQRNDNGEIYWYDRISTQAKCQDLDPIDGSSDESGAEQEQEAGQVLPGEPSCAGAGVMAPTLLAGASSSQLNDTSSAADVVEQPAATRGGRQPSLRLSKTAARQYDRVMKATKVGARPPDASPEVSPGLVDTSSSSQQQQHGEAELSWTNVARVKQLARKKHMELEHTAFVRRKRRSGRRSGGGGDKQGAEAEEGSWSESRSGLNGSASNLFLQSAANSMLQIENGTCGQLAFAEGRRLLNAAASSLEEARQAKFVRLQVSSRQ